MPSEAEKNADRRCICGHTVEEHSYEISGVLKPWCDASDCSCKAFLDVEFYNEDGTERHE